MLYAIRILLVFALFLLPCFTPRGHSADATSFDPTRIPVQAKGTIPIGTVIAWTSVTNPSDMEKWLDCNGQGVSQSVYPELYAVVGARVPDMRNQFLRGGTVAQVRQTAADTTRSHYHGQPSHTHSVGTQLSSTAVSGTAAGQRYYDSGIYWEQRWHDVSGGEDPIGYSWLKTDSQWRTASSSSVTANLNNGSATGSAYASGNDNTYENSNNDGTKGGTETAPQHMRVRYLIRALQ